VALAAKLTGITYLRDWLRAMIRKDAPNSAALSEINAAHDGVIAGSFDPANASLAGLHDTAPIGTAPVQVLGLFTQQTS